MPAKSNAMLPADTAARTTTFLIRSLPAATSQSSPIQVPGLLLALRRHHWIVMTPGTAMPTAGAPPSMPRSRKRKENRGGVPAETNAKLAVDAIIRPTSLIVRAWIAITSESSPIQVDGPEYAFISACCSRGVAFPRVTAWRAETVTAATTKPSAVISLNSLPGRSSIRAVSSSARASARAASV